MQVFRQTQFSVSCHFCQSTTNTRPPLLTFNGCRNAVLTLLGPEVLDIVMALVEELRQAFAVD